MRAHAGAQRRSGFHIDGKELRLCIENHAVDIVGRGERNEAVAGIIAERLRRSIANEPFSIEKGTKRIEVTISVGISMLEKKSEPVADVLKRADQALYRAKHDGRNRVVVADAA